MAKYRAKVASPPDIRLGDIVEFDSPLVEGLRNHYEPVSDNEEITIRRNPETGLTERREIDRTADGTMADDGLRQQVGNPSRDELKKEAEELGVDFAPNITTEKLFGLVREARDAKDAQ